MKNCANPNCSNTIPNLFMIGNKVHNLSSRKFCLSCSPFKRHNTRNLNITPSKPGSYANVKIFRQRKKEKAVQFLGGKCQICGYDKSPYVLEFHHKDPNKKDFGIATKVSWGFERIKTELTKCALLCPNCHREVHLGLTHL